MSERSLEAWFRTFLLVVAGLVLVATNLELWFSEHTESIVQLIPFGLAGAGIVATLVVLVRATPHTLKTLRGVSIVLAAGAVYGIYEHVSHNIAFELEIRPTAALGEVLFDALFGASPLLAPGALGLAALLAAAATYQHPRLTP